MRRVSQLLIASVSLYAAHPICSHAVQRQIAATVQAVATSSLFTPVMLQARLPPSLPEPSVTCALSSCNCVTCRPSHSPLTYVYSYIYVYTCIYSYVYVYVRMLTCICIICMRFAVPSSVTLTRTAITRAWMRDRWSLYPFLHCAFKFGCLWNPKLVQITTPIHAHKLLETQRHHVLGFRA